MPEKIKHLAKKDFKNNILQIKDFALVECFNNANVIFHIMKPILNSLSLKHNQRLVHYRIDADANPFIIESFYVIKYPSYLLFKDGVLIDRIEGIFSFKAFSDILENHLSQINEKESKS